MMYLKQILILLFFFSSGCSAVMTTLYGLKSPKKLDENSIYKYAGKYNIPVSDLYFLDSPYVSSLFTPEILDTITICRANAIIKNHSQPLQALYYSPDGQLVSFQINCYAGGFPNLKWNRDGAMEVFPPSQQTDLDSILPLSKHLSLLLPLSKTKAFQYDRSQPVVIVYWNRFMGRQSKHLVREIQKNVKLASSGQVKVIYVNSDNLFAARKMN